MSERAAALFCTLCMNMMNDGHFVSETHGQQNNGDMEKKLAAFAAEAKAVALLLLLLFLLR